MSNDMINQNRYGKSNIISIGLIAGCFLLIFYPEITGLIKAWSRSDEYSHGFLIFPISLYIIWSKKEVLSKIPIQGSSSAIVFILIPLLLYIVAKYANILTLAPIAMVFLLFGIIIFLFGYQMFKELLFPLFFLFLMIPIPSQIYSALTIPLQLFVTKVSVGLAGAINIPIFREGNVIHMADRMLQVVQACSGLRSMISLLTLSLIFGYFAFRSNTLRVILFINGIPVAIFVNIIRVLIMIMAFHYFDFDLTEGSVHTVFGMIIFGLALISIVLIKKVLANWDKSIVKE